MDQENKQSNKPVPQGLENSSAIDSVSRDANFVFLYKKIEKLAAAIFMVTDLMAENDAVRMSLRQKTIQLVSLLSLHHSDLMMGEHTRREVESLIVSIVSHLDIGFYAKIISEMNASILRREFLSVLEKIVEVQKESPVAFPKGFFTVPRVLHTDAEERAGSAATKQEVAPSVKSDESKKVFYDKPEVSKNQSKSRVSVKDKKKKPELKSEKRREAILAVIRQKNEVSIKDISYAVQGCSEKTIQRELADLVAGGVLKKEGEKRWTKYSFA